MANRVFTKEKTIVLKGVMVLLLLFHHLFYATDNYGPTIVIWGTEYNIVRGFAMSSRICVVAFLVLSGYGIYKTVGENVKKLFCERVVGLYLSYLFVVVTTLLITVFFRENFTEIYAEPSKIKVLYRITTSLLGVQYLFGSYGIVMAWWFASFLIICYLLYPLLLKLIKKNSWVVLCVTLLFIPLRSIEIPHIGIFGILSNLPPFVLGIVLAKNDILEKLSGVTTNKKWVNYVLVVVLIGLKFVFYRNEVVTNYFDLCLTVLLMVLLTGNSHKWSFLRWLGRLSEDIYYYHYVWVFYVAKSLIYKTQYVSVAFLTLFFLSIATHYVAELIRKVTHFEDGIKLVQKRVSGLWERVIEKQR